MNTNQTQEKKLRLLPGIILAFLILILRYGLTAIDTQFVPIGLFGSLIGGLGVIIWWAFFSKANKFERWFAPVLIILALVITSLFLDKSISTAMMGMMFGMFAFPIVCVVFVIWAVLTRKSTTRLRRISLIIIVVISSGFWTLLRTDGMTGDAKQDITWRWASTHEDHLTELESNTQTIQLNDSIFMNKEAEWPGFRGKERNGIIRGLQIETNWTVNAPVEIWRKPIGPGCSSFAVFENLIFTQEQRDEYELVTCYNLLNGEIIWSHEDSARFWDSHAGAGPRATPTFRKGKIYTLGGTGILNALQAKNGDLIWSVNVAEDAKTEHSGWGYCASPLISDNLLIIAAVGKLMAYDIETGNLIWEGNDYGDGYSSPHFYTSRDKTQILLMSAGGLVSVNPADGKELWKYEWEVDSRIVQPAFCENGDIIITHSSGESFKRLSLSETGVKEVWSTKSMRVNFNDMVIHKGHAYGYEGMKLVCVNLKDGSRKWKEGRYGGQMLLLADQDLLIILSEKGEIALVNADPETFTELHRIHAIEGKTWNHPVIVNDILLVRNTKEMLALKLKNRFEM